MAVLGVQLVGTLLAAALMHQLGPHCSFARWLLCNGSLFRYKHPSEEQLRALAGKQRPCGRKKRWANGLGEEKPLSVPRDVPLRLETCPLTAVDALALRFFPEYQWFVDFAVYAGGVYVLTEAYRALGPAAGGSLAACWCLLAATCSAKVLLTVTRLYFGMEGGGERAVCLVFALVFLLLALLLQVVREEMLEWGLEPGLDSLTQSLEPLLKKQGWDWALPLVKLAVRLSLVAVGSVLGACLTFPGLRLAQTHRDALAMAEHRPVLQLLLHLSFLSPLIIMWLWTKPVARDLLGQAPFRGTPVSLLSDAAFDALRLWVLLVLSLLRLAVARPHLQAYLGLARARVEQLRREAGCIGARELQQRVARVSCYLPVVSLQYLAPVVLTLNCTLLLQALGGYSWGLGPATPPPPTLLSAGASPLSAGEDEARQMAARIAGALGGFLTPLFCRGVLAFLIWWTAACQLLASLFGLYFHQQLAGT